jgi:hypothetical protein
MAIRACAVVALSIVIGHRGGPNPHTDQRVDLRRTDNQIEVSIGGHPFATYHFDPSIAKPYLSSLRSGQGTVLTREYPMADVQGEDHDEPHQRAMYFAHGDINGFDFWGEAAFPRWSRHSIARYGRTTFRRLEEIRGGSEDGLIRAAFELVAQDSPVADEVQAYNFRADGGARIIDCEFVLRATHGAVTLGDTKEGTFAIRLVKALASPRGRMVSSNGATREKEIWGRRARWVDYFGNVAGEDVGIAVFDHPQNLRSPTFWHARAYGLLAANPFGLKSFASGARQDGTCLIPPGETLVLRYRVLIHHGDPQQAGVAGAYQQFAKGSD